MVQTILKENGAIGLGKGTIVEYGIGFQYILSRNIPEICPNERKLMEKENDSNSTI